MARLCGSSRRRLVLYGCVVAANLRDDSLLLFQLINELGSLHERLARIVGERPLPVSARLIATVEPTRALTSPPGQLFTVSPGDSAPGVGATSVSYQPKKRVGSRAPPKLHDRGRQPLTGADNDSELENYEEPKRAYTIKEAARIYSISRSTLYNLIKAGKLPDVIVGGIRLLPRDAMEALIASKRP